MNISSGSTISATKTRARFEEDPIVSVVDDDESLRLAICELLDTCGYTS